MSSNSDTSLTKQNSKSRINKKQLADDIRYFKTIATINTFLSLSLSFYTTLNHLTR